METVEPDLKSSQVTVKGAFVAEQLTDYLHKKTGKHATIFKAEAEKKEEKEEKKEEKEKEKEEKKPEKEEAKKEEGGDAAPPPPPPPAEEETKVVEVKKNEAQYNYYQLQQQQVYPQRFVQEYQHEYPSPQMFSDENPNACAVM